MAAVDEVKPPRFIQIVVALAGLGESARDYTEEALYALDETGQVWRFRPAGTWQRLSMLRQGEGPDGG